MPPSLVSASSESASDVASDSGGEEPERSEDEEEELFTPGAKVGAVQVESSSFAWSV
jgi:hypothetical protein